jgi:two-component system phosphate regulon sensor histidine kinase PhoR
MALMGFYAGNQIKTVMEERIESQLKTCAHLTVLTSSISDIQKNIDRLAAASGARITLISNTGEVIGESERPAAEMDIHLNRPEVQEARVKGEGVAKRFSKTLGIDTLYVVVPVKEGTETIGYLRFSRPLVEIKNVAKELNALIFRSSLIVGILSFFIAFLFAKRLVGPIKKMEEFTRRVRQKNLSGTLLVESGDELGSLGNNINEMVEELREKINIANEEKSKIEAAFSSMTNGILILDKEGRIEDFNYAWRRFSTFVFRT